MVAPAPLPSCRGIDPSWVNAVSGSAAMIINFCFVFCVFESLAVNLRDCKNQDRKDLAPAEVFDLEDM